MARSSDIQILLTRSGPTEWDQSGRLQGETDLPMSGEGRAEAKASIAGLNGQQIASVFAAPDEASIQTGALLAARNGARLKKVPGLAEMDLGLWQGLLESELTERYSKSYCQWRENPTGVTAPEGESIEEANGRVLSALARALSRSSRGPVAVALRPLAFAMVRGWLEDRPLADLWAMTPDSAMIQSFTVPRQRLKDLLEQLRDAERTAVRR